MIDRKGQRHIFCTTFLKSLRLQASKYYTENKNDSLVELLTTKQQPPVLKNEANAKVPYLHSFHWLQKEV